jgi:hypothetical protein
MDRVGHLSSIWRSVVIIHPRPTASVFRVLTLHESLALSSLGEICGNEASFPRKVVNARSPTEIALFGGSVNTLLVATLATLGAASGRR